jgi:hypothetical protein
MKPIYTAVLAATAMVASSAAYAEKGQGVGNGGGGLVKANQPFPPTQVELLDLWEAENEKNLKIILDDATPVEAQVRNAISSLSNLNSALAKEVLAAYENMLKRPPVPPKQGQIPFPPDTGRLFLEKGYYGVGVARFWDKGESVDLPDNTLELDPVFYNPMVPTHKAALWFHESIYKVLRDTDSVVDSRPVRALVGRVFAGEKFESVYAGVSIPASLRCVGPGAEGYLFVQKDQARLAIGTMDGHFLTQPIVFELSHSALPLMITYLGKTYKDKKAWVADGLDAIFPNHADSISAPQIEPIPMSLIFDGAAIQPRRLYGIGGAYFEADPYGEMSYKWSSPTSKFAVPGQAIGGNSPVFWADVEHKDGLIKQKLKSWTVRFGWEYWNPYKVSRYRDRSVLTCN